jgi:hypothetical protein
MSASIRQDRLANRPPRPRPALPVQVKALAAWRDAVMEELHQLSSAADDLESGMDALERGDLPTVKRLLGPYLVRGGILRRACPSGPRFQMRRNYWLGICQDLHRLTTAGVTDCIALIARIDDLLDHPNLGQPGWWMETDLAHAYSNRCTHRLRESFHKLPPYLVAAATEFEASFDRLAQ